MEYARTRSSNGSRCGVAYSLRRLRTVLPDTFAEPQSRPRARLSSSMSLGSRTETLLITVYLVADSASGRPASTQVRSP